MRLVRGGPGAGKTALVFREFKQSLRAGEPARIVVPTATLVRHFQHELARDGVVFSPSAVVSLSRLAGAQTNPVVRRAAVKAELSRGAYPEFGSVAETAGLIETLVQTIGLFENAGATASRLAAVRKLSPHALAFARLWKAIELKLPARQPELPTGRVWMDGFLSFSPLDWELVTAISKTCDLTLTLPDSPAFNDVRRMAMALGAKDEPVYGGTRRANRTVVEAPSVEREADEIARRVLKLHQDGTAFREIGIALRDAGTYLPLLRSTLERFGIPARYYFSESLAQHPAATFLNGIVNNTLSGWDFAEALETLRAHPAWGRQAWFDKFDFMVREAMPGRGADALKVLCDPEQQKKLDDCLSAAHWTAETVRVKDWVYRLIHMAQSLYRPGMISVSGSARDVATARHQAAGLRAWMEAIESAAECWDDQDQRIPLAEFWAVAQDAAQSSSVTVRDDRRDVVHVMNVFEARQWDVAALFVCGMTNREFPKKAQPNLLFSEAELDRIVKAGIPVRRAADTEKQEEALMVSLEGRASSTLVLSYPTHDAGGRASERSAYVNEPVPAKRYVVEPRVAAPVMGRAGVISRPELLSITEVSATSLEEMTQCRFRFFATRALGIKPRPERPRERLSPRNMGSIIHSAMETWVREGRVGTLVDAFDREFEQAVQKKHLPLGYDLEVERYRWRNFAAKLSGKDRWMVTGSEPEATLMATLPGGLKVKCRIDRIDFLPDDECIIIDYKSGAVGTIKGHTKDMTKLQGQIYALAAQQERGLNTVAMMYIAIQNEEFYGWGEVPGMKLELEPMPADWIENARDRAQERVVSFLSGDVHAQPTDVSHCKWCNAKNACRVTQREALVMVEGAHGA